MYPLSKTHPRSLQVGLPSTTGHTPRIPILASAIRHGARLFTGTLLVGAMVCGLFAVASPASAQTAMQTYVEAMQPGWNLGNTLDAIPTETSWGNPLVTQEFIQQIAAQGFKSIRLPVTWTDHTGPAPGYAIDPVWMDRVEQIVDWSLDAGMYVMINIHHDSWQWVSGMPTNDAAVRARFDALWTQIADRFKDHSNRLMLESINEPFFAGVDDATQMALLDELNTSFFNVVRASGGGNATRPLVLPTLATNHAQSRVDSLSETIANLDDPNLIATIHYYGFWPFSVNIAGYTRFEGIVIDDIHDAVDNVYETFVANGIPVVIGEYGLLAFDTSIAGVERGEMLKFFEYFTAYAQSRGMALQWWDNGQHFARTTYQWRDPELVNLIMHSVTGRTSTANTDLILLNSGAPVQDAVIQLNLNGNSFVGLSNGDTPLTPGTDYTISGGVLTVKASALAAYASGPFGEKTVLDAHFSSGQPWKLRVRYHWVPVLSPAVGTKVGGLVIPAAFNGDLVATMEAIYVGGGNAGPQNWTSFKEYTRTFGPNYTNDTIAITPEFFAATNNNPIDLTFHFWSGRTVNYRLSFVMGGSVGGEPQERVIYENSLAPGWGNWSWATVNLSNTENAHSAPNSIGVDAGAWGGVMIGSQGAVTTDAAYRTLTFWAHGGTTGGQNLAVSVSNNWNSSLPSVTVGPLLANTWTRFEIPLDALGVQGTPNITSFTFMQASGNTVPRFYLDDIRLTTAYASTILFVHGAPAPVITSAAVASGTFESPFSYAITAIHNPLTFSATGLPPGLELDPTTGVIAGTPTAAGTYSVSLHTSNAAGSGMASLAITINPAPVTVTLPGAGGPLGAAITHAYDGAPQDVEVVTNPPGIPVTVTYNGSTTVPTLPGNYHVVVTSDDPNYTGSVESTLVITVTALVRHAPTINGDLDGSLQLLSGEGFAVNGRGAVSGDLLVPGTPSVLVNGHPVFGGVVDAEGSMAPSNYGITLNGGAVVRFVVRRVDPIAMPEVTAPAMPTGTRTVTLNNGNQSAGDFATIRNLTLNGNAGTVNVPPGVYGSFTVNGNGSLVLGVAGDVEPAVYELQSLTLNGNASVDIVGPVSLTLANGTSLNGTLGSDGNPQWLTLRIAQGGLTLNGNAAVYGIVMAPNGSVSINGALHGRVSADRLTINGNGSLEDPAQAP